MKNWLSAISVSPLTGLLGMFSLRTPDPVENTVNHELDFGITSFSHCLVENPRTPRVLGSWIRSSEPWLFGSDNSPQAEPRSQIHAAIVQTDLC
jgi:hypothetical protein